MHVWCAAVHKFYVSQICQNTEGQSELRRRSMIPLSQSDIIRHQPVIRFKIPVAVCGLSTNQHLKFRTSHGTTLPHPLGTGDPAPTLITRPWTRLNSWQIHPSTDRWFKAPKFWRVDRAPPLTNPQTSHVTPTNQSAPCILREHLQGLKRFKFYCCPV